MRRVSLIVLLAGAIGPGTAGAFSDVTNQGVLARGIALPPFGRARVIARTEWRAAFEVANEYESTGYNTDDQCVRPECQKLDGETYRVAIRAWMPLADGWDASIELPYHALRGGELDGAMQDWHRVFGLPNGGREAAPGDRVLQTYIRDDRVLLLNTEPAAGPGDLRVGVGRRVWDGAAVRMRLKLPTGDAEGFTGGNAGAALWIEQAGVVGDGWSGYAALGVSVNDRNAVLAEIQRRVVPIGGAGLRYALARSVGVFAQVYLHGRIHDGALRAMRRNGAILGLGVDARLFASWRVALTLLEDSNVNVSPDFGVQLLLDWRPPG